MNTTAVYDAIAEERAARGPGFDILPPFPLRDRTLAALVVPVWPLEDGEFLGQPVDILVFGLNGALLERRPYPGGRISTYASGHRREPLLARLYRIRLPLLALDYFERTSPAGHVAAAAAFRALYPGELSDIPTILNVDFLAFLERALVEERKA